MVVNVSFFGGRNRVKQSIEGPIWLQPLTCYDFEFYPNVKPWPKLADCKSIVLQKFVKLVKIILIHNVSFFQGETSPCLPNPCSGGGTCEEHDNTFTCFCPDDRTGDRCERALSENDLRVRPLE